MKDVVEVKVSVMLITYNHASYIAEAIDSALMQETDFAYEIVIGEDESNDGTREIVLDYQRRFPDKIRVILHSRDDVIYINGRPTGRWNFIDTHQQVRGQYIAHLDGDDYWVDPRKLQKQVDFLDANPRYALCFHAVASITESEAMRYAYPPRRRRFYTLEDLLQTNFIPHLSVVVRNHLVTEFPEWFSRIPVADYPFHIMLAQHGNIGYLDEVMGVYRVHGAGIFAGMTTRKQLENRINGLEMIKEHLDEQYDELIESTIDFTRFLIELGEGQRIAAIHHFLRCIRKQPQHLAIKRHGSKNLLAKLCLPQLYDALRRARNRYRQLLNTSKTIVRN